MKMMQTENGCVKIGDDDMYYASFGSGERCAVLLPGLSDGLATVKGKALLLSAPYRKYMKTHRILMFSRRNHLPENHSIRAMADEQAEALDRLGIQEADVLGVSQGGMIAQYLAADHPELVRRLVLAVTASHANEVAAANIRHWITLAEKGDYRELMMDTAVKSYSDAYLKKNRFVLPLVGVFGKPESFSRFLSNAHAILSFDAGDVLGRISCPVMLIGGSEDKIVGNDAIEDLAERIPGSTVHIYEGLGHAAYEEAADFNDRVFRFFDAG